MTTETRSFELLDVFAETPFTGNPLPVIVEADDLDAGEMMRITRWMNQSETTFLLPPTRAEADYRVRIFTLERELPFAGHPTLGSCRAWLNRGGKPADEVIVVQECGAGLVRIRRREDHLAFAAPPLLRRGRVADAHRREVLEALRVDEAKVLAVDWADNGPGWILVHLPTAEDVLALAPAAQYPRRLEIGVIGAHAPASPFAWEIRTFFSDQHGNLREDPVTGSFNASAAQWLRAQGLAKDRWRARQGTRLERAGVIDVAAEDDETWIGGRVLSLVSGQLHLPPGA